MKTEETIKLIKYVTGSVAAVLLAAALQLQFAYAAGIITLLTIQDTKKETVRITVKRMIIFVIMTILSAVIFPLAGYHVWAFGIVLIPYLFSCMALDMKEAIAPIAVLCTHYVSAKSCSPSMILNEFLILVIGAGDTISNMLYMFGFSTTYSNTYIAGLLAFLPLFIGLYTSVLCGSQIPNEFKDRTAYLNISLPISRSSFYIGKYLAGLILCLGIFMFAYGSAVATAMMRYDTIFSDLLGESLMLTIIAVFAYSATAFCVGSFMKRGSSLIPFILMSVVIPVVVLLVGSYTGNWALGYLPSFLGEAALGLLGSTMTGSVGMPILGNIDLNNIVPMAVVGVVWGFAFLILGLIQTKRREM